MVNTRAGVGTFPFGLVTMLFLVLFVWGCAGKERGEGRKDTLHNKSVKNKRFQVRADMQGLVTVHVVVHLVCVLCVRADGVGCDIVELPTLTNSPVSRGAVITPVMRV